MAGRARALSPPRFLAASIVGLIAAGTAVLALPLSSATGQSISLVDAFFTATSAVCVTGLIVLDTPNAFSTFGQGVILFLIQLGGLGYMTISTLLSSLVGRHVSMQERLTLQEALNTQDLEGLVRFAVTVFKLTLIFELTGAVVLTLRWLPEYGLADAAWLAVFHAVSAFNNAGFSLWSDNLTRWRSDVTVNIVISALVICGGLGFLVLSELTSRRVRRIGLSLHTRIVLAASAILLVLGTLAVLALEWNNPRTIGAEASFGTRVLVAWFHSASARTAGFNTLDIGALTAPTLFLLMALMFIGASPGSTGGGVKTTTFSITVAALWATVRGDYDPVLFKRRLPAEIVAKAFFVSLIAFLGLNAVAGAVLLTQGRDLLPTLFETTSAFGTVGLSTGQDGSAISLSGFFDATGKLLISMMMFMGRVGPLTLAVALAARRAARPRIRLPEGKVLIG